MQSSSEPGQRAVILDANVLCLHFRTLVEALQKRGLLTPEQARQASEQAHGNFAKLEIKRLVN